jgi:hypothetical protein
MLDAVGNHDANRKGRRPVPASIDTVGAGFADDGVGALRGEHRPVGSELGAAVGAGVDVR